jgi:hypothetical protein
LNKIIAGISVYMSANNISELNDGLPDKGNVSIDNFKPDLKYSFKNISAPPPSNYSESSDVMTTRSFHFRQLRDERYYKNEYEKLDRGSRWVFVREAQVGKYKASHIAN